MRPEQLYFDGTSGVVLWWSAPGCWQRNKTFVDLNISFKLLPYWKAYWSETFNLHSSLGHICPTRWLQLNFLQQQNSQKQHWLIFMLANGNNLFLEGIYADPLVCWSFHKALPVSQNKSCSVKSGVQRGVWAWSHRMFIALNLLSGHSPGQVYNLFKLFSDVLFKCLVGENNFEFTTESEWWKWHGEHPYNPDNSHG